MLNDITSETPYEPMDIIKTDFDTKWISIQQICQVPQKPKRFNDNCMNKTKNRNKILSRSFALRTDFTEFVVDWNILTHINYDTYSVTNHQVAKSHKSPKIQIPQKI